MNPKERMLRALAGQATDTVSVAPSYLGLYLADECLARYVGSYERKLGGRTSCAIDHADDCRLRASAILRSYDILREQPDWLNARAACSREWAARGVLEQSDGRWWHRDLSSGEREDLAEVGEMNYPASLRYLRRRRNSHGDLWDASVDFRTTEDIDSLVEVRTAEELEAQGVFEVVKLLAREAGDRQLLTISGHTPYLAAYFVLGFNGMMLMMNDRPDLFRHLMRRKHQQSLELFRGYARAGLHAVWIQEAFSGADLISPTFYDEFVFPTSRAFIRDVTALGLLSLFVCTGNIMPRLPRFRDLGAAGIAVEEGRKGYSIEIGDVIDGLEGACSVFGNVDPVGVVQQGTAADIDAEVKRQVALGRKARGFILNQGSPFPLDTPPAKIDLFMAAAR